jgi:RNA polymerase sigma-B factor
VLEALLAAQSRLELSLDCPVDDDADRFLGDLVAAPGPREESEDLLALPRLIAALPELDRRVIILRFFHDLDQDTIAAEIGYSQMQVSRLLRRALTNLRVQLLDAEQSRIGA